MPLKCFLFVLSRCSLKFYLKGSKIWPWNLIKWFLNTQEWNYLLNRTSGQIFFLVALASSDLAAFQSDRQHRSPASNLRRACSGYLYRPSLWLRAPSGTIFYYGADSSGAFAEWMSQTEQETFAFIRTPLYHTCWDTRHPSAMSSSPVVLLLDLKGQTWPG